MRQNLIGTSFFRNTVNLALVCAVFLLVTACFCRTDSEGDDSPPPPKRTAEEPAAGPEKTDKKNAPTKPATDKKPDEGDFIVEHLGVENPRYAGIDKQIKENKTLEKAANDLNQSLVLPFDIFLRTKDCGDVNAFYDPNDHSVTVCYELMEHFYRNFRKAGSPEQEAYNKMFDAVRFAFLHEIGHALIDAYKLPITGNEEDAADRASSYINLEELGESGVRAIMAAADSFAIESKERAPNDRSLADEHLLQEQRFYNSLCMIYGSNASKYAYIVTDGYLPKERAVRCPGEYERTVQGWSELLKPWRKD